MAEKMYTRNKLATIRRDDPAWMHNGIRKITGKRKRAHLKAKRTNP